MRRRLRTRRSVEATRARNNRNIIGIGRRRKIAEAKITANLSVAIVDGDERRRARAYRQRDS